ncbi:MAG: cbb3-type cytochrome oxidase assembly protein CcoS [Saprospirales bacterium]|nr:MAG: cbb3-type cytochrome oxidase assembly protein CcoS [Saprospirales bacterium]
MGIILLLLLASICLAGLFLWAFLWALKSGQYDDVEGPAVRILFDDTTPSSTSEEDTESNNCTSKK